MRITFLSVAAVAFSLLANAQQTIYFDGDFTKFCPQFLTWERSNETVNGQSLDGVGTDNENTDLPGIGTPKLKDITGEASDASISPLTLLQDAGWSLNTNISFQRTDDNIYLKMSVTNKQGFVTTPPLSELGEGKEGVHLSYEWCPWKESENVKTEANKGKFDVTQLVVIVENGDNEQQFVQTGHDFQQHDKLKWIPVDIDLSGVTMDKNTRITIRNIDSQYGENGAQTGVYRYFIKNLKVYGNNSTAVSELSSEKYSKTEYFNLQGMKVENPSQGLYIKVTDSKTEKVFIK